MQLHELKKIAEGFDNSPLMPVLFLGHGSPMNAIEENQFVQGFRNTAATLPKPNAILCISAHCYTRGTFVTGMEHPKTIHDFGGFPRALYEVQYPAPGDPALAAAVSQLIDRTTVTVSDQWGLDHGAWSVIKHLYPHADIPVVQMSIDYTLSPEKHFEIGEQLYQLRKKGILIVGSGNIIHNLGLVDFPNMDKDNYGYDWAIEARQSLNKLILDGNFAPLLKYNNMGLAVKLAVPTPDHYLPLIYALALRKNDEPMQLFNDKLVAGSLSMTSVKIG